MTQHTTQFAELLDTLCPMNLVLSETGHVAHAGSLTRKIFPEIDLVGKRFGELFELKRTGAGTSVADLRDLSGQKLQFVQRVKPNAELKAIIFPLDETASLGPKNGLVINFSFGISVLDAVKDFSLSSTDFAGTDMAVEMLFLYTAKAVAMDASHKLTKRLQWAKAEAEDLAHKDTLTGVHNRRALALIVERLIEQKADFTVMLVDLDFFKAVNDKLGHAAGDYVLKAVTRVLKDHVRSDDLVVRSGGDEFVIVLKQTMTEPDLTRFSEDLIKSIEVPIDFEGEECRISASLGTAQSCDYEMPQLSRLMADADKALYAAKEAGRGRHVAFGSLMSENRDICVSAPENNFAINNTAAS